MCSCSRPSLDPSLRGPPLPRPPFSSLVLSSPTKKKKTFDFSSRGIVVVSQGHGQPKVRGWGSWGHLVNFAVSRMSWMRLGRSETLTSLGIRRTVTARSRAKQRSASFRIHVITKKLRDLRLSKMRTAAMLFTLFSIQRLGTREDFNPARWSSALQDNNVLVSVSPSFRGDVNPTTGFFHFEWHLRKTVNGNEHCFSCRIFGFTQVNQVTTRVKSESMLIEESCARTRSVGMAFAESSLFPGPSDDFTSIFCTLSDKH